MSSAALEQPLSILISDNDLRMRESLRDLLDAYGMPCNLAEDGQQALALMNQMHFDLVLLDFPEQQVNSLKIMRTMHDKHPDTEFIILSAGDASANTQTALRWGARDFLNKPFDPAGLIRLINSISKNKSIQQQKAETASYSEVEKTLLELEDIIQTEDLNLTNDIINSSPIVTFIWKSSGIWPVQFISENVVNLLGYTANEFISGKVRYKNIIHPDDIDRVNNEKLNNKTSQRLTHKPYRVMTKSGMVKWLDDCAAIVRNETGNITHYKGILIDVTKQELARQKMLEEQQSLEYIAYHDTLTGLPNRFLLMDRLKQSIKKIQRSKKQMALLYIDLDKFKEINDNLGHHAGDEVLKSAAERLLACVRAVDTVARIGGDEFIVILETVTSINDVKKIANKLNHSLQQSVVWNMHEMFVTSSIGISLSPDDSEDPDELLKKADIAMYQSKKKGRNTYQFYQPAIE